MRVSYPILKNFYTWENCAVVKWTLSGWWLSSKLGPEAGSHVPCSQQLWKYTWLSGGKGVRSFLCISAKEASQATFPKCPTSSLLWTWFTNTNASEVGTMPLILVRSILQGQDSPHLNLSKSSGKKTLKPQLWVSPHHWPWRFWFQDKCSLQQVSDPSTQLPSAQCSPFSDGLWAKTRLSMSTKRQHCLHWAEFSKSLFGGIVLLAHLSDCRCVGQCLCAMGITASAFKNAQTARFTQNHVSQRVRSGIWEAGTNHICKETSQIWGSCRVTQLLLIKTSYFEQ